MIRIKTFRSSLIWSFLLATVFPLLALGCFSYFYMSFKIKESIGQSNELLAETVANEITAQLREPAVVLRQVGLLLDYMNENNPLIASQLNSIVSESGDLEGIFVLDEKKSVIQLGVDEEFRGIRDNYLHLDLSGLKILKNIKFLQGMEWSSFFRSPVSGKKSIGLISPLNTKKYLLGVVNIKDLYDTIFTLSKNRTSSIFVLDDRGDLIFHPELKNVLEHQNFTNIVPYKNAQLGIFGEVDFSLGEQEYTGSTANISSANWLVIVAQRKDEALKPLRNMADIFLFAALVSLMILLSLAVRLSQRLYRPLDALQKNIQAVADGDYSQDIDQQSHQEFENVAEIIRQLSDAIAKREKLLEINEERLIALLDIHDHKHLEDDELLKYSLEQAVSLTRSEIAFIHLLDEQEKSVRNTFWSEDVESYCLRHGISESTLENFNLWHECLHNRQPAFKNSYEQDKEKSGNKREPIIKRQLSNPIFDDDKIVAVVGVFNKNVDYDNTDARQLSLYFNHIWDILQQKKYERDKGRLGEQLAQAQKLEAIGTLAGGIAHDFNNVLMVIIGNTELAKDNINKPEKLKNDLEEIFRAGLRARDLVNQILAFSREQAEGRKPMNIKPMVKEAVKLLRSSIPANVKIHQHIANESLPVITEPGQINQLIMNLSTNAYQALDGKPGKLEIHLYPETLKEDLVDKEQLVAKAGQYMVLVIKDDGKGIPTDKINRIFEPYYTTREKERGTGLGLAVVHGIVKGMKGTIVVESEPDKGSSFIVYLPTSVAVKQSESNVLTANLPGGTERVLYVDDDQAVARTNAMLLQNLGYTVSTFNSSTEALEEFKNNPERYELVISDFDMPDINGDILAAKMLEINEEIPVILCTGYGEQIDKTKAEEIGVRDLIFKPVTKIDLALTVRKVLGFSSKS